MTTILSTENQVDIWYGNENDSSNLIIGVENIGTSTLLFFDGQTLTKLDIEDGINHVSLDIQSESWGFILFNQNVENSTSVYILDNEIDEAERDINKLPIKPPICPPSKIRAIRFPTFSPPKKPPQSTVGDSHRVSWPSSTPNRPSPQSTVGVGRREVITEKSFIVVNNLTQLF